MPKYCVVGYMGAGTGDDPYRPLGVEPGMGWAAIDFRPDSTVIDGFCIVAYPDVATIPKSALQIAGHKTDQLSLSTKTLLSNKIGLNLDTRDFGETLLELLTTHATPPGDKSRWNPLMYTKDKRFEIWIGEKIVDIPFVAGGATYTESFNVANVNPLVTGDLSWTYPSAAQDMKVVSSHAEVAGTSLQCYARADHDCSSSDNYGQIVIISTNTTAGTTWGAMCRIASTAFTAYLGEQGTIAGNVNNTALSKLITGTATSLATSTYTKVTNEVIKVEANGSTITFYTDGASNISTTDTSVTAGVRTGYAGYSPTSTTRSAMDSFTGNDIAFSATTSPSTIARAFAINAPALNSLHGATVIARSLSIGSPTVTADSTITTSVISRSFAINAPTVVGGSSADPSTLVMTAAFPAPTVTGDSVVTDPGRENAQVSSVKRRGSTVGKPKTR